MAVAHRNIHALHHDRYANGGVIKHEAEFLDRGARVMLSKTKIVPNLARASMLLDVFEHLPPAEDAASQERMFNVFHLLSDCYEPVADDVLILAAFEIHAKAQLLRRGYAIHEIHTPSDLKRTQRRSPVHVRSIRALGRRGTPPVFTDKTIGISSLMAPNYFRIYRLPSVAAETALEEVRRRRNFVHFGEPYTWALDRALLNLVSHLERVIPQIVVRRRRA